MDTPKSTTSSPSKDRTDNELDETKTSASSNQSKLLTQNDPHLQPSHTMTSDPVLNSYNLFKSKQFSQPTSDSDDESLDGTPKYGQKRSDTLPNSYFSCLPILGWENTDLYLDSYSSDEDSKAKLKIIGKGKSLLKKNVSKSSKKITSDNKLKDSILSSFAETCYKCKLCKISPCYMASVESFIFHMKNQHSDIYKEMLLKSTVANGNCSQVNDVIRYEGSSSDEGMCNYAGRITSEHLLKYSKLWQNSPKSSATDPKPTEDSKPKNTNIEQIQKVTDQFLKSSATVSLPNCQPKIQNGVLGIPQKLQNGTQSPISVPAAPSKVIPATNQTPKNEKSGWKGDLPPSFTPEFGRYTKLVREGGNIVYFCQVCNWKCQVKAAFTVHCNGQQHHNKVRLADQNNVEKCKQKTEPNNVEAAIRKAIDYSNNLNNNKQTNNNNNTVKLPIINVPKVPNFNKTFAHIQDPTKLFANKDSHEKPLELEKSETRNKRKRPFPVRKSSPNGDDWADSESEDETELKKTRREETFTNYNAEEISKTKSQMLGSCPSMVPMDDYFSRYSAQNYRHIPDLVGFENKGEKSNEEVEKEMSLSLPLFPTGYTGLLPESRDDNSDIQYRCTFCNVFCTGLSDYKDHFKMEHDIESPDLTMADGKGGQNNEWWKMMKIKETLSDLLITSPKGNVSRDLLLHKVSLTLNMPEVIRWGPSCNKAVREEFPHSMAQRKGKFKKYFFGVTLVDQIQEQEELSDSDMNYQPLRDMSHDLERILEHLPALMKWTGNYVTGISRDDVLELLAQRIEEREVTHWGVQCNRAVRMLFPDIQMKRKGKYKTTVFYGVDFINKQDVQKLTKVDDKEESLPIHFRDEDINSPYPSINNNPMLSYNPVALQHNELAMQYQSQLFNMWRFMSPFHHFSMHPNMDMMGMGGNSLTKGDNSISTTSSPDHHGTESPVLSVGSKSDLDQFMGSNSRSPLVVEDASQSLNNCSTEERKDRESNGIVSASPVPVVSS